MKILEKITLCAVLLFSGAATFAQSAYDALMFSEQYMEGTARSAAMGNAFTALGGDMGSITINPASSAVYRYSELAFTPSINGVSGTSSYLGNTSKANATRLGISNCGYIGSYDTGRKNAGLVNWSFGLVLNKQNNFTNSMKATGRTAASSWLSALAASTDGIYAPNMDINNNSTPFYNGNASWNAILAWNTSLLDTLPGTSNQYIAATENLDGKDIYVGGELGQYFRSRTRGNITEATINFGGNFANKLFVGANLGIQSIAYKYDETYSEDALNTSAFNSGFRSFTNSYKYMATGAGINLKAGIIYLPVNWLRLGAGISTPTWMYIDESWENSMQSEFSDGYSQKLASPLGTYNYNLETPFRWNVGAAVRLGTLGVISTDYENVDYSKAILSDASTYYGYPDENEDIEQLFGKQSIIRIGAEANLSPVFALRAGYQHYSSPYAEQKSEDATNIGSAGIGYIIPFGDSDLFVDLTYQQLLKKTSEQFSLYDDTAVAAPVGTNRTNKWKVLLTMGIRF